MSEITTAELIELVKQHLQQAHEGAQKWDDADCRAMVKEYQNDFELLIDKKATEEAIGVFDEAEFRANLFELDDQIMLFIMSDEEIGELLDDLDGNSYSLAKSPFADLEL